MINFRKYNFIILFFWAISSHAQQIVFPYEYKSNSRVQFSANGEIMGIIEDAYEFPILNIVEARSGHILAKVEIPYQQVLDFKPSYTGEYIAVVAAKGSKTDILFYSYLNVNDIQLLNTVLLIDDFADYSSGGMEITSKYDNSFYLKIFPDGHFFPHKKFQCLKKFTYFLGSFEEDYALGNMNSYPGTMEDNWLYLFKTNFMAYELSYDEKRITILSDRKIPKKQLPKDIYRQEPFSFALVDWRIKSKTQSLTHLFTSDSFFDSENEDQPNTDPKRLTYGFNEGFDIYGLHYIEELHRVYGIGTKWSLKELLLPKIKKLQSINGLKRQIKDNYSKISTWFWSDVKFNDLLPFYYDIDSGTFHLVANILPEEPFLDSLVSPKPDENIDLFLRNKSSHLGIPIDFYFSPNTHYLYVLSKMPGQQLRVSKIDLKTEHIEFFEFNRLWQTFKTDFTTDNKLILYDTELQKGMSFNYTVIDLEHLVIINYNELSAKQNLTIPRDVFLTKLDGERQFMILTDSSLLNFNFSNLPFHKLYPFGYYRKKFTGKFIDHYEKTLPLAEKTTKTELNDVEKEYKFSFFPEKHHVVFKNDGKTKFMLVDGLFNYKEFKGASSFEEESPFASQEVFELVKSTDTIPWTGYDNLCTTLTGFSWHEASQRVYAINNSIIEKWNDAEHKSEFVYKNHKAPIHAFDVCVGDSLMVSASVDGKISIWNVFKNKLVANLYVYNNGVDWIYILPDNYYYGTKGAVSRIAFAFKNKALPIEYFELKYNRPDLVLKALGNSNVEIIKAFKKAYLKRLEKMNLNESVLQIDFDVPYLQITNQKLIPAQLDLDSLELDLNIYDHKNKLERINIYINGVGMKYLLANGGKGTLINKKLWIKLRSGINKIEVSATNVNGIESEKQNFETFCSLKQQAELYIISIGAGHYSQNEFNLNYAEKDAKDFSNLFEFHAVEFQKSHKLTFIGEQVSTTMLSQIKDTLAKATINDVVYLYYAGHGILDQKFDYYLGTYAIDFKNPSANGILYDDFENILANVKALQKTILLDACHSGEIEKDEVIQNDTMQLVENITFRNVGQGVKNKNTLSSTEILKEVFSDMRKGTGATVISSAGGVESAMESSEWKNGLFTYCLLHGLKDLAADLNKDGEIYLSELQTYLRTEVLKKSHGKQQPTSRIENLSIDYKIW